MARHSEAIEDCVLAIYRLAARQGTVRGTALAAELHLAPATVTEMLGRLRSAGLVVEGRPVRLSDEGLRMARALASRHRLAERFLVDALGLDWEDVHEEAHRLEHALSPRVTERLAAMLGHPTTCPHGHPIMEDGGEEPDEHLQPLSDVPPGGVAIVRRIAVEEHDLLADLRRLGIGLDSSVSVDARDGTDLRVRVAGRSGRLPREQARSVLVAPAS